MSVWRRMCRIGLGGLVAWGVAVWSPAHARVLDDFNDNTKTGWTDFTFVPGFGLPQEQNQRFQFDLTGTPQTLFTAAWKTTESLELKEGRTIELRVDLVQASGENAFAVLAFIPNTGGNDPKTLAGYALAKDPTDVLITKGIQRYFVEDDSAAATLRNENVTLSLILTARGGEVTITGRILDKDNQDAVLWERTVVDTLAADVLEGGTDEPPAPFITSGHFALYCYAQEGNPTTPYTVALDNAEVYLLDEAVLDNFDDNTKTGWQDFTFVPGFGLPQETGQQFGFDLTGAPQTLFTSAWKTSQLLEVKEGEQLELSVDLVQSSGEDAYYVMGFIPNTGGNDPTTLMGYGLAKDPTDMLMTKSIQRYFVADAGPEAELKNDNLRMVLHLLAKNGSVWITGRVLDRDANDAVIWERTVVDTPAADVMADGDDSPPAPFLTTGHFTLFCYAQNPVAGTLYTVAYDNAVIRTPPAAGNLPPSISNVEPVAYGNFLPATTQVRFQAGDDQPLAADRLAITLNGTRYTTANGLAVSGTGATLTASLGNLQADVNYMAVLEVMDAGGLATTRILYFDTFLAAHRVVEVEDFNFIGLSGTAGQYVDDPVPVAEGNPGDYSLQAGTAEVDYHDTRPSPNGADTMYRPGDPVRMQRSLDILRQKYADAGGAAGFVYDYDVGDLATGEWLHFTRRFANGTYEVYLRQALANMDAGESVLELVTGDRTQPDAATQPLGSFLGERTGFQYRNFPLTDGTGQNRIILRLNGETTLRLRQITPDPDDGSRFQNYLVFIPVADPGEQRATVSEVAPANGATVPDVVVRISATIRNRDTAVRTDTVALTVNGAPVPASVNPTADGATVEYALTPLPATGSTVTCRLSFKDTEDVDIATDWSFTLAYTALDPANRRSGPGIDRGLAVRMVQAPAGSNLANSLARAEEQLAPNSSIPKASETTATAEVINQTQAEGAAAGYFTAANGYPETVVPGLTESFEGTDDFSVEIQAWLELPAGAYRFGVVSDDGYKITSGATPTDTAGTIIGFENGTADETTDFVVTQGGFYPFRMIWYERGGSAHAEWFSADLATGERTLINDPASSRAIKAYRNIAAEPDLVVQSTPGIGTPFTDDATAVINSGARTITAPVSGAARFFRLRGGQVYTLKNPRIQGADLVIEYQ